MEQTELSIVGAGPFGLAMAAEARRRGIAHRVVGEPMAFWREHMPVGMVLRSGGRTPATVARRHASPGNGS